MGNPILTLFFLMKFYATIEPCRKLKNVFSNLSSFYIIDVDQILEESKLDITNKAHVYLINTELERLIVNGAKSKRYNGLIYINSNINESVIDGIKDLINSLENSNVDSFVLLDDVDVPKLNMYYVMFDEVVFFPSMKRTRIIECSSNVMKYNCNNNVQKNKESI